MIVDFLQMVMLQRWHLDSQLHPRKLSSFFQTLLPEWRCMPDVLDRMYGITGVVLSAVKP